MALTISYIDTCRPDYLQDHHNRDGELLLGVCLAGQNPEEAAHDLLAMLNSADWGVYPEDIDDKAFLAIAKDAMDVDFRPHDETGNPVDKDDEGFFEACEESESQAWFLLKW